MKNWLGSLHKFLFDMKFKLRSMSWQPTDERKRPAGPVIISGFFDEVLGIGRAGRLTVDAFRSAGFEVMQQDLRPLHNGLLTTPPLPFPQGRNATVWLIHANPPEAKIALFSLKVSDWQHLYRIGYWAWESDLAPDAWLNAAPWFHELWVPSVYVQDAFCRAFTTAGMAEYSAKLRVVPHPQPLSPSRPATQESTFRVLTIFDARSGFERKNPTGAIASWLQAFPRPVDGAILTVKSPRDSAFHPEYKALVSLAKGRPDIQFLAKDLSNLEQEALFDSHNSILSLHRGEGFGLPLAEAMARGHCAIATGYSGNLDFMTSENSVLIPWVKVSASNAFNGSRANWAEPDVAAAARALRTLANDPERRQILGNAARRTFQNLNAKQKEMFTNWIWVEY